MQLTQIAKLLYEMSLVGGSIFIGYLFENLHKVNFIAHESTLLQLNEVLLPLVGHFLHHLVEWVDPRLAIMISQSWCSYLSVLTSFLPHPMIGQSGGIL